MTLAAVREALEPFGRADSILSLPESSATVEQAAAAIGVEAPTIAKTISVYSEDGAAAVLIVVAGDARLHNGSFKRRFGHKPRMLRAEDVEELTGHAIGGVCPFGNPDGVVVWLDESLRRFEQVWPAAGDAHSAIGLTLPELERCSGSAGWVDVANGWRSTDDDQG